MKGFHLISPSVFLPFTSYFYFFFLVLMASKILFIFGTGGLSEDDTNVFYCVVEQLAFSFIILVFSSFSFCFIEFSFYSRANWDEKFRFNAFYLTLLLLWVSRKRHLYTLAKFFRYEPFSVDFFPLFFGEKAIAEKESSNSLHLNKIQSIYDQRTASIIKIVNKRCFNLGNA